MVSVSPMAFASILVVCIFLASCSRNFGFLNVSAQNYTQHSVLIFEFPFDPIISYFYSLSFLPSLDLTDVR